MSNRYLPNHLQPTQMYITTTEDVHKYLDILRRNGSSYVETRDKYEECIYNLRHVGPFWVYYLKNPTPSSILTQDTMNQIQIYEEKKVQSNDNLLLLL